MTELTPYFTCDNTWDSIEDALRKAFVTDGTDVYLRVSATTTGGGGLLTPLSGTFTTADLVLGVLTINHAGNGNCRYVLIMNPSFTSELVSFTQVTLNQVTVDFGGAIPAGTWSWTVFIE